MQEFQKKAEMVYSKVEQTVKSLRGAADKLDQVCRDRQKAHAVGAAGGVVSGLITLGVTAMTGGAASPLLLATGMGFGVVGAAINWGSSRIETATNSQFLQTSIQVKRTISIKRTLGKVTCVASVSSRVIFLLSSQRDQRSRRGHAETLAAQSRRSQRCPLNRGFTALYHKEHSTLLGTTDLRMNLKISVTAPVCLSFVSLYF